MAGFFGYVSIARSDGGSRDGSGPVRPGSGVGRNPWCVEPSVSDEISSSGRAYFIGTSRKWFCVRPQPAPESHLPAPPRRFPFAARTRPGATTAIDDLRAPSLRSGRLLQEGDPPMSIRRSTPLLAIGLVAGWLTAAEVVAQEAIAIVGATVIDGNGGEPLSDATVVVEGARIAAIGPSTSTAVPDGARIIDGAGKFLTPGFVDTNVHTSLYGAGFGKHRKENAVFYWERGAEIALEAAQMHLKHGVTHVRDSYGQLPQLIEVRDAIAEGREVGPRMQVAGNIVGWGGAFSVTFSLISDSDLSLWEEQFSDHLAQGAGEDLMDMYPEELRVAINDYLDKGVDFVKYGGSSHWSYPTMIGFSPEAQRVIVEETHRRGLAAETHATNPESLRLAVEAGIDLIQHPEVLAGRPYSEALLTQIRERGVICSMLVNTITGAAWEQHLADVAAAEQRLADDGRSAEWGRLRRPVEREKTSFELRRERNALGQGNAMRRQNAKSLIDAGCIVTLGTDNFPAADIQFLREPKPIWQEPGIGTLMAIEGLV
ncbi:MAG: amidohydrolase family protein, partial [Gemmatimonadales bacterium]|nr:amidohydrolase family protein [Gemmatimonadales bacterium]